MSLTKNEWYNFNKQKIENLKRDLDVMRFTNEHAEVPIKQILQFIEGSLLEISKLQKNKEDLTEKLSIKKE
jgi:hypothetical protein